LERGALTISHIERDDGWFAFILTLRHPLFSEIIGWAVPRALGSKWRGQAA
jgi:hypothetical protein